MKIFSCTLPDGRIALRRSAKPLTHAVVIQYFSYEAWSVYNWYTDKTQADETCKRVRKALLKQYPLLKMHVQEVA